MTPASDAVASSASDLDPVLAEGGEAGRPGVGLGAAREQVVRGGRGVRVDGVEDRRAQVDVGRVEHVRLDRQRLEPGEGRPPVGAEPGGLACR